MNESRIYGSWNKSLKITKTSLPNNSAVINVCINFFIKKENKRLAETFYIAIFLELVRLRLWHINGYFAIEVVCVIIEVIINLKIIYILIYNYFGTPDIPPSTLFTSHNILLISNRKTYFFLFAYLCDKIIFYYFLHN